MAAPNSQTTTILVGGGAPATMGTPAGTIGFYGVAGVVQQTKATAVTTTGASSTTNAYGYTTAAQADAIVTAVNAIIVQLTNVALTT